jgi:hypothetical protein
VSLVSTFASKNDYLSDAEISPNGRFVSLAGDQSVLIDEVSTGRTVQRFPVNGTAYTASFSPDDTRLLVANWKGTADVYEVATGRRVLQVSAGNWINSGAWNPNGATFATGSRSGAAQIWDAATGALKASFRPGLEVFGVAFSPNGSQLVTTTDDGAQIWDVATGREVLSAHLTSVGFSTSFSPNGKEIVFSGSHDYPDGLTWASTEIVWSLAAKRAINTFVGPSFHTFGNAAFSPNGDVLAIPDGSSGTVTLWCVASGATLGSFVTDPWKGVDSVFFNTNGTELLTGDASGVARLWRLDEASSNRTPEEQRDRVRGGRVRSSDYWPGNTMLFSTTSVPYQYAMKRSAGEAWPFQYGEFGVTAGSSGPSVTTIMEKPLYVAAATRARMVLVDPSLLAGVTLNASPKAGW